MKHMREIAGEYFKGKKVRAVSNCTIKFDVTGRVVGYDIRKDELILTLEVNGKFMEIGENQRLTYFEFI